MMIGHALFLIVMTWMEMITVMSAIKDVRGSIMNVMVRRNMLIMNRLLRTCGKVNVMKIAHKLVKDYKMGPLEVHLLMDHHEYVYANQDGS